MFKNIPYLIVLLLVTVTVNAAVIKWLFPNTSESFDNAQLDQVLQGIKQQSSLISTLENSLKQLNSEVNQINIRTLEQENQAETIADLQSRLSGQTKIRTPATTTETVTKAPISDERLAKIDEQFASLQQQLDALLATQNQLLPSGAQNTQARPNPYAGLTREQAIQQQEIAFQQKIQQLQSNITTTTDPGRTTQISSSFESYLSKADITDSPPQVSCNDTLCRFQFSQKKLSTQDGDRIDPMMVLMESGAFPADGTQRTIITRDNDQGGMDLYVGDAESFPSASGQ